MCVPTQPSKKDKKKSKPQVGLVRLPCSARQTEERGWAGGGRGLLLTLTFYPGKLTRILVSDHALQLAVLGGEGVVLVVSPCKPHLGLELLDCVCVRVCVSGCGRVYG